MHPLITTAVCVLVFALGWVAAEQWREYVERSLERMDEEENR